MSRQITQPSTQIKLTNIAVVRYSPPKTSQKFEIACYKNKIIDYRNGIETEIGEVLQTEFIYKNVSQGVLASKKDLIKYFKTSDTDEVLKIILIKGNVQISDKEREQALSQVVSQVCHKLCSTCVNPATNRRYTPDTIRQAMKDAKFSVHPTRNVKQQFLDCLKLIQNKKVLPIERAKMHIRLLVSSSSSSLNDNIQFGGLLPEEFNAISIETYNNITDENEHQLDFLIDPYNYRKVEDYISQLERENEIMKVRMELINNCVMEEGDDVGLELELTAAVGDKATTTTVQNDQSNVKIQGANNRTCSMPLTSIPILTNDVHRLSVNGNDDVEEEEEEEEESSQQLSRKDAKKAQKKSKKAKRREKEEASERKERREAELRRQEERDFRLKDKKNAVAEENLSNININGSSSTGEKKSCNTCGGMFTPKEYRDHFKSDWHRFNMKLKLKGGAPVSFEEFELCDADFL